MYAALQPVRKPLEDSFQTGNHECVEWIQRIQMLIEILLWFHPRILSRKFMNSVRSFEFSWSLVQINV